jgi:hypothetical protein
MENIYNPAKFANFTLCGNVWKFTPLSAHKWWTEIFALVDWRDFEANDYLRWMGVFLNFYLSTVQVVCFLYNRPHLLNQSCYRTGGNPRKPAMFVGVKLLYRNPFLKCDWGQRWSQRTTRQHIPKIETDYLNESLPNSRVTPSTQCLFSSNVYVCSKHLNSLLYKRLDIQQYNFCILQGNTNKNITSDNKTRL